MKQTCILILGMHRSGTSALSGTLSILDVYLGSKLIPALEQNAKGFFENAQLNTLNNNLLKSIKSDWDDVFYNEDKIDSIVDTTELERILKKEFQYSQLFAIKDPRLAYLFPLYTKALKKLGVEVKIIIPFRNPLEVAGSLNSRDKFSQEKSLLLWAYHFLLSEKYSRGFSRVFTSFDELVQSPQSVIKLIDKELELNLTEGFETKKDQIYEFLTPGLKHHNIALDNLSKKVPKIVRNLVSLVPKLNNEDTNKEFDELYTQLFDYQALFYNPEIISLIEDQAETGQTLQEREHELAQIQQAFQAQDGELQQVNQTLQAKDEALAEATQALQVKGEELEKITQVLQEKKQVSSQVNQALQAKEQELAQIQQAFQAQEDELQQVNQTLQAKDEALAEATQALQVKGEELEKLTQVLQEKKQENSQVNQALQAKERELAQIQQAFQVQEGELQQVSDSLQAKDEALVQVTKELQVKGEELENLTQVLQEKEQKYSQINQALQAKERELAQCIQNIQVERNQFQAQVKRREVEIEALKDEIVLFYENSYSLPVRAANKIKRLLK